MPIVPIHLKNASLDKTLSDEETNNPADGEIASGRSSDESDSTSALSNLLDTLKLRVAQSVSPSSNSNNASSGKDCSNSNNNSNNNNNSNSQSNTNGGIDPTKKRVPIDPSGERSPSAPALNAFTQLTASLSASSEDISDAISKTFEMFRSQTTMTYEHYHSNYYRGRGLDPEARLDDEDDSAYVVPRSQSDDYIRNHHHNQNSYGSNSPNKKGKAKAKGYWVALPMPPGFRQSRSADGSLLTRSERTSNILQRLATKDEETDVERSLRCASDDEEDEDSCDGWGENTAAGSRDVSLLDAAITAVGGHDENEESGGEEGTAFNSDEEEDDYAEDNASYVSGYDSIGTMDSQGIDEIGSVKEGLLVLGGVLYELGTCTFKENTQKVDFDDDYTISSNAYPPMAKNDSMGENNMNTINKQHRNPKKKNLKSPKTPGGTDVYMPFDDTHVAKGGGGVGGAVGIGGGLRTPGGSYTLGKPVYQRAPTPRARKGILASMFACGGPLP